MDFAKALIAAAAGNRIARKDGTAWLTRADLAADDWQVEGTPPLARTITDEINDAVQTYLRMLEDGVFRDRPHNAAVLIAKTVRAKWKGADPGEELEPACGNALMAALLGGK